MTAFAVVPYAFASLPPSQRPPGPPPLQMRKGNTAYRCAEGGCPLHICTPADLPGILPHPCFVNDGLRARSRTILGKVPFYPGGPCPWLKWKMAVEARRMAILSKRAGKVSTLLRDLAQTRPTPCPKKVETLPGAGWLTLLWMKPVAARGRMSGHRPEHSEG